MSHRRFQALCGAGIFVALNVLGATTVSDHTPRWVFLMALLAAMAVLITATELTDDCPECEDLQ